MLCMKTEEVNSEPLVACCLQMGLTSELDNPKARDWYCDYECCAYDSYLGWDIQIYKRLNTPEDEDNYIARYRLHNTPNWYSVHKCYSIPEIKGIVYTRIDYWHRRSGWKGLQE